MDDKLQFVKELPKQYDSSAIEEKWYRHWEEGGLFRADAKSGKLPYTIVIPPPNVTGVLHMGHALNNTLQDILIRYRRMTGREALWIPGTDHAGIATQNVVERALAKEDLHREDLGREAFIKRVWEWKKEYGGNIVNQLRKLGSSCDWERERFTMDEGLSRAVREVFVRLYEDGLIYRGRRLINWCVRCHSALADDEVEHEEKAGHLWHIQYLLKDSQRSLVVATTRPETMLGDTAVAVHPNDERYQKLIGLSVILPVSGREIPIIADEMVNPEFGTGVVKVTPAHDPNDYECGLRHGLEQITVIAPDGTMSKEAGKYEGLDRFRCRELLIAELEELKLLDQTEAHSHAVGQCYRCQTIVEPYLSEQWFVSMKPLAERALEASRNGEVRFHPSRWEKVYRSWLENVRDWCISRQIWWGHRLPVWYCSECLKISVSREDITACLHCASAAIRQDDDVLDTWFSSALWPFSTLGWPEETEDLQRFYPTNTLVTARDIIYFWVARMVMMGLHFRNEVPFQDVYIHGNILDAQGRRMSKSLGNGIDPLELIGQYGADAVRYTLAALTTEGQDIKLAPTRFEMGRNFVNKLWNASRFCLMNLAEIDGGSAAIRPQDLDFEDHWILSRFAEAAAQTTLSLESFRYSEAAAVIRDFAWHDFCDWYLEIVKGRFRKGCSSATVGARVLALMLDSTLRLLHPLLPFVTEEIWELLGRVAPARGLSASPQASGANLIQTPWPVAEQEWRNEAVEAEMVITQEVIRAIRNVRSKFSLSPKKELACTVSTVDEETQNGLSGRIALIQRLANTSEVTFTVGGEKPPKAAAEVMERLTVYVPLAGLMDVELERARLASDLGKKQAFLEKSVRKLQNEEFTAMAKPEVVQRERDLKTDLEGQIAKIEELIASLRG